MRVDAHPVVIVQFVVVVFVVDVDVDVVVVSLLGWSLLLFR